MGAEVLDELAFPFQPLVASPTFTCSGRTPTWSSPLTAPGAGSSQPLSTSLPSFRLRGKEVHLRRADETGHEPVHGRPVDFRGRADLLQLAGLEDRDSIAHGGGFGLVVGDVDGGHAEALLELADFDPHLVTQVSIEVGERLIEQEYARLAHEGAAERHALPLAAESSLGFRWSRLSS